jgi:hypothetical protein
MSELVQDATEPYELRGCIAEAWGVADLFRYELLTR